MPPTLTFRLKHFIQTLKYELTLVSEYFLLPYNSRFTAMQRQSPIVHTENESPTDSESIYSIWMVIARLTAIGVRHFEFLAWQDDNSCNRQNISQGSQC